MKTACKFPFMIALALILMTGMPSCEKESITPASELLSDYTPEAQMVTARKLEKAVYPLNSKPFDLPYAEWTKEWWRYVMSKPCDAHPANDDSGEYALTGQTGPVIFLTGTTEGSATRRITIPKEKAILVPLANVLVDYPCPGVDFRPAPGQSLYFFLAKIAKVKMDRIKKVEISLNGIQLFRPQDFRVATNLFRFTGNPDLANCFDPCVTGKPQDAVSDGYWMMLKKLPAGLHKLHIHVETPFDGSVVDVTYEINVE